MVIWFWLGIITRDNKPSLTNRTELGEERLPTLRLYNTLYYLVFHYKYIVLSCISLHHVTSPTFRCGMTISSSGTKQTTAVSACYDCPQTRCGSLTSSSSTSKLSQWGPLFIFLWMRKSPGWLIVLNKLRPLISSRSLISLYDNSFPSSQNRKKNSRKSESEQKLLM